MIPTVIMENSDERLLLNQLAIQQLSGFYSGLSVSHPPRDMWQNKQVPHPVQPYAQAFLSKQARRPSCSLFLEAQDEPCSHPPCPLQENRDPRKMSQCSEAKDPPNSWSNQSTEFPIKQRDKRPDECHPVISTALEEELAYHFLDFYSLSTQAHSRQPRCLSSINFTNEKLFLVSLMLIPASSDSG